MFSTLWEHRKWVAQSKLFKNYIAYGTHYDFKSVFKWLDKCELTFKGLWPMPKNDPWLNCQNQFSPKHTKQRKYTYMHLYISYLMHPLSFLLAKPLWNSLESQKRKIWIVMDKERMREKESEREREKDREREKVRERERL